MNPTREKIVEKLQKLPETELLEVLNFVEFIVWRTSTEEPLLSVAGILSGDPLYSKEIEDELYNDGEY